MGQDKARRYSAEEKAAALAAIEAEGLAGAAKTKGIPKRTLSYWAKQAGIAPSNGLKKRTQAASEARAAQMAEKRELLRMELQEAIAHALEHALKEGRSGRNFQAWATGAAILIDKFRLESGEHTSHQRMESDDVRHGVEKRVDELAQRRQAKTG